MPELPEVETTVRGLRDKVVGKRITGFWCDHARMVRYIAIRELARQIRGARIISVRRKGKHILIDLDLEKTLIIHMKMTGHLLYGKYKQSKFKGRPWIPILKSGPLHDPYNRFIHAVFILNNNKHIVFCDMRKFGKIALHNTSNLPVAKELESLGPELWELDIEKFVEIFKKMNAGKIKQALLNQTLLAGVGNIYSDEGLWTVGIHPLSQPAKIPKEKLKNLFSALVKITKYSLKTGGDSMSDYRNVDGVGGRFQNFHKAYRRTDERCLKNGCRGIIKRIVIGGRGSHFCSSHQKLYD